MRQGSVLFYLSNVLNEWHEIKAKVLIQITGKASRKLDKDEIVF